MKKKSSFFEAPIHPSHLFLFSTFSTTPLPDTNTQHHLHYFIVLVLIMQSSSVAPVALHAQTRVPSLKEMATDLLKSAFHPQAAAFIDASESDLGLTLAHDVENMFKGSPAQGRTLLGDDTIAHDAGHGNRHLSRDNFERATGKITRVNPSFHESEEDEDWYLQIRLSSPVIPAFHLQVTWTDEHRQWIANHLDGNEGPLETKATGRMSFFGSGLVARLYFESGRLRVDSTDRECAAVWLEYTLPTSWLQKLLPTQSVPTQEE